MTKIYGTRELILDGIERVMCCVSKDTSRRLGLCSVLLRGGTNGIDIVATNGHRLARYAIRHEKKSATKYSGTGDILIPANHLKQVVSFLKAEKAPAILQITQQKNRIEFSMLSGTITVEAHPEGTDFPSYLQVIPDQDRPSEIKKDKPATMGLEPTYLGDVAKVFKGLKGVHVNMSGELDPILITAEDIYQPVVRTLVIMPHRGAFPGETKPLLEVKNAKQA